MASRDDAERDTARREERYAQLAREGRWVPGEREPEPLAAGRRDES